MGNPIVTSEPAIVRAKSGNPAPGPLSPAEADWQRALAEAIRDPDELCQLLDLPPEWADQARRAGGPFRLFVPRGYAGRMRRGDPFDPLLRQVLPVDAEREQAAGFTSDPVGDLAAQAASGMLRKYAGRALLVVTGACAIHCRYCFRRHFPYSAGPRSRDAWLPAIEQIERDTSLSEVILSGGDPLSVVDERLAWLVERLAEIPHLARLRIHSRLPVVLPERVTAAMVDWFCGTRLTPVAVIHANHAAELDDQVAGALRRLAGGGALLLNQSVLLRGVNDRLDALCALSERLLALSVVPYYLHQLDRVSGAAHFEVPEEQGRALVQAMRAALPGYAVPRYVREIPGEPGKRVLL